MPELFRYAAFISYSSNDAHFARRLHRALEQYNIPTALGRFDLLGGGGKANRIYPVFRDREELPTGELGDVIEASLRASGALIVICSPSSAASPWVRKEIEYYASIGRRDRVFTIITDDAPLVDASGDATPACIPSALREAGLEPLAADARRGRDGFRGAWLKVVAGLIGVNAGALADRDQRRRRARRIQALAASFASAVLLVFSVAYAISNQLQQRSNTLAELARAASDEGEYLRAMRYARAAMTGQNWPLISFDATAANVELRRAMADSPLLLAFSDDAELTALAVSADGARIVTGNVNGVVRIWDSSTGQRVMELGRQAAPVDLIATSASRLATASREGEVSLWNVQSGELIASLGGHQGALSVLRFSPDGAKIVTISAGRVHVWRASDGAATIEFDEPNGLAASFSPDGRRIAIAGSAVHVWDAETGQVLLELEGHAALATVVAFSPNGSRIITGSADRSVLLWNAETGRQIGELDDHEDAITAGTFSPDGETVLTADLDGMTRLWNPSRDTAYELPGHTGAIRSASFSSDGDLILTASVDGSARLWSGREVTPLYTNDRIMLSAIFTPDGDRIVTAGDETVRIWSARPKPEISVEQPDVQRVAFAPDDDRFAGMGEDVRIWRQGGVQLPIVIDSSGDSLRFISGGSQLLIGSRGTASLWDAATGRAVFNLQAPPDDSTTERRWYILGDPTYSADGRHFAVADLSGVQVFDAHTGAHLRRIPGVSAAFGHDGSTLIVGQSGGIRLVRVADWTDIATLAGHRGEVSHIAASGDGRRIATVDEEKLQLWDATNLQRITAIDGQVANIEFSVDGRRLLVVGARGQFDRANRGDQTRLLDAATGRELTRFRGYSIGGDHAAISADGERIVTAHAGRYIRVWRVNPALDENASELAARVCATYLVTPTVSRFSDSELRAAPQLNPVLDGDVCRTPSLLERARALMVSRRSA